MNVYKWEDLLTRLPGLAVRYRHFLYFQKTWRCSFFLRFSLSLFDSSARNDFYNRKLKTLNKTWKKFFRCIAPRSLEKNFFRKLKIRYLYSVMRRITRVISIIMGRFLSSAREIRVQKSIFLLLVSLLNFIFARVQRTSFFHYLRAASFCQL